MTRERMVARSIRVPEDVWQAALTKADDQREILSQVIREALERYAASGSTTGFTYSPAALRQITTTGRHVDINTGRVNE